MIIDTSNAPCGPGFLPGLRLSEGRFAINRKKRRKSLPFSAAGAVAGARRLRPPKCRLSLFFPGMPVSHGLTHRRKLLVGTLLLPPPPPARRRTDAPRRARTSRARLPVDRLCLRAARVADLCAWISCVDGCSELGWKGGEAPVGEGLRAVPPEPNRERACEPLSVSLCLCLSLSPRGLGWGGGAV